MHKRIWLALAMALALSSILFISASEAEKLKVASGVRLSPVYYLPMVAAEEKGHWKELGLDGEWVPFSAGRGAFQAMAAGHLFTGLSTTPSVITAISRGLSLVVVMMLTESDGFSVWVRTDSRLRASKDLKGARIGVSGFGATEHAYGRLAVKIVGLDRQVKFVGTGGIRESLAALKVGAIDAVVLTIHQMVGLKLAGEVKELIKIDDHRPKEWVGYGFYGRKDWVAANEETIRRAVKVILKTVEFLRQNPSWAMAKMKEVQAYSDEAARLVYQDIGFSKDGKIDRKGMENVRNFLIEFGVTPKEKTPPAEELYTERFLK